MIPVIINNRNRYTTTKKLVDDLLALNEDEIIYILDNESTYPELMIFYTIKWTESKYRNVHVIPMPNHGHLALWASGLYKYLPKYFVYTDSDVELNPKMTKLWKSKMLDVMWDNNVDKVALALNIDDLPDHYAFKNQVIRNESRWWQNMVDENVYEADTDTTFALYKNTGDNMYKSLRMAGNFTARHVPWYHDLNNLDAEEKYYLEHLGDRQLTQYSKQHKNPELYADR